MPAFCSDFLLSDTEVESYNPERLLQVADYWTYPNRYEILTEWWRAHGMGRVFAESTLPALAIFIIEDGLPAAFMAADMSNSIGKATIENAVTAPGRSAAQSRRALQFGEKALFHALKDNAYGFCTIFTSKAIARTLVQNGWIDVGEVVHLIKPIE